MSSTRRMALLVGSAAGFGRGILDGVSAYLQDHGPWSVYWKQGLADWYGALDGWDGDGIIARIQDDEMAEAVHRTGLPAVNVSGLWPGTDIPRVTVDDAAAGRMAAGHLLDCGFHSFGFVGYSTRANSRWRFEAFRDVVEAAGWTCACYEGGPAMTPHGAWTEEIDEVGRWIADLPRPAGVWACSDVRGWHVSEACRRTDLRVPEDVALLGMDNDELVCRLSAPPLSSIAVPWARVGAVAAALLDRMMDGSKPLSQKVLVPPVGVVARRSSDALALDDGDVVDALRFIRGHADRPIRVADVLEEVPVSRRSLERRFLREVGRTLSAEIRRAHVERARRLLAETDLAMPEIAEASGFIYPQRLSTVFKGETGHTPSAYRDLFRPS